MMAAAAVAWRQKPFFLGFGRKTETLHRRKSRAALPGSQYTLALRAFFV